MASSHFISTLQNKSAYKWEDLKAEELRGLFNEKVSQIRAAGSENFFQTKEWVNGAKQIVNRTEPVIEGENFFYYETLDGKFISAGKMQ